MCLQVMEGVFGHFAGPEWRPKRYVEGKGRYLWTYVFVVLNFISLWKATEVEEFLEQKLYIYAGVSGVGCAFDCL